ncbi:hypothetical protein L228DRAFT_249636 [Xylona heveae TC161]|uniref:NACHT-NTPase and P-loop NTPases N-terminal domain-containing protein n=1 Tax=Xylona heveae (strain CBS 132557 / TC161) TaxID=1328760 RepID=A0A165FCG5_XYLHT|nr:hypothetical protein L228DRAFT_249636 [Xylona heveae TC161]KZF20821.1 hypothetical protein L228DRAFT_249636 [Xylona heveae TC161]
MDIATGVVGCFGVAVQLIETVDKIQKFLRSLDEVPEDLATINSALTVIRIVLIKIKAVGNICNNDQALLTALPECERAVNFLDSVVKDLERGVDDMHWVQRIRARIKAARREGKLEKLESKLEQAKSTLLLAVKYVNRSPW